MKRLTEAEQQQIYERAELGQTPGAIAAAIQRAASTVQWFMYSRGLRAPKQRDDAIVFRRGNVTVRRFTREEDRMIEALRADGMTHQEIADRVNARFTTERKPHSIKCRLIMLAAIETAGDLEGVA